MRNPAEEGNNHEMESKVTRGNRPKKGTIIKMEKHSLEDPPDKGERKTDEQKRLTEKRADEGSNKNTLNFYGASVWKLYRKHCMEIAWTSTGGSAGNRTGIARKSKWKSFRNRIGKSYGGFFGNRRGIV